MSVVAANIELYYTKLNPLLGKEVKIKFFEIICNLNLIKLFLIIRNLN